MGRIVVAGSENGTGNKTNHSGRRRQGSVPLSSFTPVPLSANPCWNVSVERKAMRHAKLGPALLVALLTQVACTTVPPDALDTACDSAGCISLKKFAANIDTELNGKVVGYISLVGPLGIITTYGQARTAADPPARAMDQFIPTDETGKPGPYVSPVRPVLRKYSIPLGLTVTTGSRPIAMAP